MINNSRYKLNLLTFIITIYILSKVFSKNTFFSAEYINSCKGCLILL